MSGERLGQGESEPLDMEKWEHMDEVPMKKNDETGSNKVESNPEKSAEKRQEEIERTRQAVLETYDKEVDMPEEMSVDITPDISKKQQETTAWQTIGRATKATGHGVLMAGACVGTVLAPYLAPVLLPVAFLEAGSMKHSINGVNGSMFEVDRNNKITQTANPIPVLLRNHGKTKSEIFMSEAQKLFDGLETGETYTTRSHIMTYQLLKSLQKEGKIENLKREEDGKSRLMLESLATGNFKALFKNKKHTMYQISFSVK